jgi:chromosomal replication initiation ATPase DnaA
VTKCHAAVVAIAARIVALYGLESIEDIFGRARSKTIAEARLVAHWAARHRLGWSYPELGRAFDRDHSTIIQNTAEVELRIAAGQASELMVAAVAMFTESNLATAGDDATRQSAEQGAA